jgi:hypothetical protein
LKIVKINTRVAKSDANVNLEGVITVAAGALWIPGQAQRLFTLVLAK